MEHQNSLEKDIYIIMNLLNEINQELFERNLFNLDYILLKSIPLIKTVGEKKVLALITQILSFSSNTYKTLLDNPKYSKEYWMINDYMKEVLRYYDDIMINGHEKFDRYVEIVAGEKTPNKKIIKEENTNMSLEEIQKTMSLLNEAVRIYHEIYHNKKLMVEFTSEEIIEFKLKESELAHILGVNLKKIVNNPKYVDLFKITNNEIEYINDDTHTLDPNGEAAVSILHKIIDIDEGDILEFEKDRIIKNNDNYSYKLMLSDDKPIKNSISPNTRIFSKINVRSKVFIDFKPLEQVSLLLQLPEGKNVINQNKETIKQHSLLITENNLSDEYKYSTLVSSYIKDYERRFFETLLIKKPEEFKDWQREGKPAISKKVVIESEDGSSGTERIFSEIEQRQFLDRVKNDFNEVNFDEVINYYDNLSTLVRKLKM